MGCQNTTPSITDSLGRTQYPVWINESGLYSLILGSKLEKAKEFKHWVTAEVLPTIRKTGGYINPGQEDLFVETYLPFADENVKNFFRLNMQAMAQQNKIIKDQKLQLESQQKDLNEKDNRILAQRRELSKQHEQLEFKDQQIEEYVNVVTDLVKDVPLAGKRAIINERKKHLSTPRIFSQKRFYTLLSKITPSIGIEPILGQNTKSFAKTYTRSSFLLPGLLIHPFRDCLIQNKK